MKIGFYTFTYIDVMSMPYHEVLDSIAEAGYDGVDLSATKGRTTSPEDFPSAERSELRRYAESIGLEVGIAITHEHLTATIEQGRPMDLKGFVDVALDLGADTLGVHVGPSGNAPNRRELWEQTAEVLRGASAYAADRGALIALTTIWPGDLLDTTDKMLRMVEDVGADNLRCYYDPGFLLLMGLDPVAEAQRMGDLIAHVHVKDCEGRHPDYKMHIPGEGELDLASTIGVLNQIGYDRYVSIETFSTHPFDRACFSGYASVAGALTK